MASLDSFAIFKSKINRKTPVATVTSGLNELRLGINRGFYQKLSAQHRRRLHFFLWTDLHNMWLYGSPQLKIAAASTAGHILVFLVPFFQDDFMFTLTKVLSSYTSSSLFYLACYCYISKFYSPKEVTTFSKDLKIWSLIPVDDMSSLPQLTKELLALPQEILFMLAQHFMRILMRHYNEHPNDDDNGLPNIVKAANIIISRDHQHYAPLITENTPFPIIADVFGENLPKLKGPIVDALKESALRIIQDFSAPLKLYSGACRVLSTLISTQQVPFEIAYGIFNSETIKNTVSMEHLLLIPIEPDIVYSLYGNQSYVMRKTMSLDSFDSQLGNVSALSSMEPVSSSDQSEIDDDINEGSIGTYIPQLMAPMYDLPFLPSLPLPDMPTSHDKSFLKEMMPIASSPTNSPKHSPTSSTINSPMPLSAASPIQSPLYSINASPTTTGGESPASVERSNSRPPIRINPNNPNNPQVADLSSIPPPSIPSYIGGQKMPLSEPPKAFEFNLTNSTSANSQIPFSRAQQPLMKRPSSVYNLSVASESMDEIESNPIFTNDPTINTREQFSYSNSFLINRPKSTRFRKRSLRSFSSDKLSSLNGLPKPEKMPPISRQNSVGIPIEEYADFISSQSNIDTLRLDPKFIAPLMNYFRRFPRYHAELCNLVLYCISTLDNHREANRPIFEACLKSVTDSQEVIQSEPLNCILYEIFSIQTEDARLKEKILEMIGTLCADKLTRAVADKMYRIIDDASISKVEIFHKKAKIAFVQFYKHTSNDLFKFFFDMYIQKLDIFDENIFTRRISFIAYVINHTPGNWHLSFMSVTTFLGEAINLFTFHRRVLLDILIIMAAFSHHIQDTAFLSVFIKHAINIVDSNYKEFSGGSMFANGSNQKMPPLFDNNFPRVNTLSTIDTDLTTNPGVWHDTALKCGKIAYKFLANIPWENFNLNRDERQVIVQLIFHFAPLLPQETCDFLVSINNINFILDDSLDKILLLLIRSSRSKKELIALSQLIIVVQTTLPDTKFEPFLDSLKHYIKRMKNITYAQVLTLKQVLAKYSIKINPKIFEKIIHPTYLHCLQSGHAPESETFKNKNAFDDISNINITNMGNEEEENLENFVFLPEDDLQSIVVSLTPLVYVNLEIGPDFLRQSSKIGLFCNNSSAILDETQCAELLEFVLQNHSSKTLFYVIRYAQKYHYHLNLADKLNHPFLRSKKMFQSVFSNLVMNKVGFSSLSKAEMKFVKDFFKKDFGEYLLNANSFERKNAIFLLKFDPDYFLKYFKKVEEWNEQQLCNFCMYIQVVKFNAEELFEFIIELFSKYSNHGLLKNLVRRMMSLFMVVYGKALKAAPTKIFNIITCEIGCQDSSKLILDVKSDLFRTMSAADIVEICFMSVIMSRFIECQPLLESIAAILTKSTPYYRMVRICYDREVSIEYIQDGAENFLPSINIQTINATSKYLKAHIDFVPSMEFFQEMTKLNFLKTVTSIDCYHHFLSNLLIRELPYNLLKHFFSATFDFFDYEVNSSSVGRCLSLCKLFIAKAPPKSDILDEIFNKLLLVLETSQITSGIFMDMFASVAKLTGKIDVFVTKITDHLMKNEAYNTCIVAESAALQLMQVSDDVSEAQNVLSVVFPDFFVFFNAIVAIEKRNRSMEHSKLQTKFRGVHLKALKMLVDPKFRLFSPLLALFREDVKVPTSIHDFLKGIGDKIQRVHVTDTYHEF